MPVRDSRNRRGRGLYQRNGRYYAQLWVDRGYGKKSARRFPVRLGGWRAAQLGGPKIQNCWIESWLPLRIWGAAILFPAHRLRLRNDWPTRKWYSAKRWPVLMEDGCTPSTVRAHCIALSLEIPRNPFGLRY